MFEVAIGNIGVTYRGHREDVARLVYDDYVSQSKGKYGRVAGENVTLIEDGDIIQEFINEEGEWKELD